MNIACWFVLSFFNLFREMLVCLILKETMLGPYRIYNISIIFNTLIFSTDVANLCPLRGGIYVEISRIRAPPTFCSKTHFGRHCSSEYCLRLVTRVRATEALFIVGFFMIKSLHVYPLRGSLTCPWPPRPLIFLTFTEVRSATCRIIGITLLLPILLTTTQLVFSLNLLRSAYWGLHFLQTSEPHWFVYRAQDLRHYH